MDAINKALDIFELFLSSEDDLSIKQVSEKTSISYPTVHRITSILVNRGYFLQTGKRGKYSVHPAKLSEYIGVIKSKLNIRTVALPYMNDLSQTVNEAVLLAICRGYVAITVDVVNRGRILNITPDTDTPGLYYTGTGKIFLANLSDKEFLSYLDNNNLLPRTSNTITDKNELIKNINEVRCTGIAFDDEENESGLRSVAAPIRDWDRKVVAAISIIGPTSRINKSRINDLAAIAKEYALTISRAMGAQ